MNLSLLPRPLLLLLLLAVARADEVRPEKVAQHGAGVLYRYGEERVLVVRGAPREMGLAHGRLLAKEIREDVQAFLHDWAISARGRTREELQAIWDRLAPHIPKRYHEEIEGIAEGSGVPLGDIRLIHAIPSRYHCTGSAALPVVTRYGKVYHTRSLDYALDIGKTGGRRVVRLPAERRWHLQHQQELASGCRLPLFQLQGDAKDSPIVSEQGNRNQYIFGGAIGYAWQ